MKRFTHQEAHKSPLKDFLLDIVPANAEGNKTVTHLAALVPCRRSALQKWLKTKQIPQRRVLRLIEISAMGGREPKTLAEFAPYLVGAS